MFDGDLVFTTDNQVLLDGYRETPVLMCLQRKGDKKAVSESDFVEANIRSFGDEIGKITNRVTTMYDVQSKFEPGSREYEILDYRIQCGQL